MSWVSMNRLAGVPRYLGYGRDHACPVSLASYTPKRGSLLISSSCLVYSLHIWPQMSLDAIISDIGRVYRLGLWVVHEEKSGQELAL
jgi:hypothetical protein